MTSLGNHDNHTEGDSTVRQCTAVGYPGPLAITWYLNGLPISRHTSSQSTVSSSDTEVKVQSTLTLNNLDKDDLGTLMCVASNSIGSDNETTYFNVVCKSNTICVTLCHLMSRNIFTWKSSKPPQISKHMVKILGKYYGNFDQCLAHFGPLMQEWLCITRECNSYSWRLSPLSPPSLLSIFCNE